MADDKTPGEYGKTIGEAAKFNASEFIGAAQQMSEAANIMTRSFTASRARVSEMMSAVSEASPRMRRLGADFNETVKSMGEIALATKKNTLASADSVAKLYATSQVLDQSVKDIVNNFTDVGVQFGIIGGQLEESVATVRDLGLNAQQVMGAVVENASKLNKFNFEGGVQGLTKMAAKAAMFRFDMSEAFNLAEDAMNPERAIELASTFQRLGVSVGVLADPFAMMNASINDPGALQESLTKAAQQFTFFDEKTKSFKINPQGMLTLRQMAKETGMSYDNLAKSGLAAAELDKRLSQISPSLTFKDESDKQFLSNLSEMDATGEYVVKIRDAQGIAATKKLSDVTQEEFDNLIKEQKEAPKSMEDIARASMKTGDIIANDVGAIKEAVVRGAVSTSFVKDNMEALRKIITIPTGIVSEKIGKTEIFNKQFETASDAIRDAVRGLQSGKSMGDVMKEVGSKFKGQGEDIQLVIKDLSKQVYESIKGKNLSFGKSEIGDLANNALALLREKVEGVKVSKTLAEQNIPQGKIAKADMVSASVYGTQALTKTANPNQTLTSSVSQTIDYTGTVTFKIDAPPGVSTQYLEQYLNTETFKEMIYKYIQEKNKQKEKTK